MVSTSFANALVASALFVGANRVVNQRVVSFRDELDLKRACAHGHETKAACQVLDRPRDVTLERRAVPVHVGDASPAPSPLGIGTSYRRESLHLPASQSSRLPASTLCPSNSQRDSDRDHLLPPSCGYCSSSTRRGGKGGCFAKYTIAVDLSRNGAITHTASEPLGLVANARLEMLALVHGRRNWLLDPLARFPLRVRTHVLGAL
jgi:hypothetical protein